MKITIEIHRPYDESKMRGVEPAEIKTLPYKMDISVFSITENDFAKIALIRELAKKILDVANAQN